MPSTDQMAPKIVEKSGVYISTYGCQMNVNDSERMYTLLEMSNYVPVTSADQASLIIINSCSVREKPVHKVHSEVGRYRKLKEKNPSLKIGVAGCVAQQEKKKLLKDVPLVDFVIGTDSIDELPQIIAKIKSENKKSVDAKFKHQQPYQIETLIRNPGVSTFINITKGCDNFCTFCVVPFTRGRERSRPYKQIVEDVNKLISRGVKEVYFLGQNVNSYTSDCGVNFAQLLKGIALETDIERIRYTTSHPKDFNQELIDISQEYREKICEYIHLPVQSGSTSVLERMNRVYTREGYLKKVKMILDTIPGVALSTDIIVGFPGETDEDFEQTLTLLEEVPFETLYAYKYSPRPFTKAARYTDQVPEEIKSERLTRLFKIHKAIAAQLAKKYLGQTLRVLVEQSNGERSFGRSQHNKVVHFKTTNNLVGQTVDVKIHTAFPATLRGELVGAHE